MTPQEKDFRKLLNQLSEDQLRDLLCFIRALKEADPSRPENLHRAAYGNGYKERATNQ